VGDWRLDGTTATVEDEQTWIVSCADSAACSRLTIAAMFAARLVPGITALPEQNGQGPLHV